MLHASRRSVAAVGSQHTLLTALSLVGMDGVSVPLLLKRATPR